MISFDDFDAWGEAVSGASLRLVCDAVEVPRWSLGILDLGGVVLQMATEGGGNLCYGVNTHAGPLLFVPLSHAAGHVVNGVRLDEESLFAIPQGADFSIHVRHRAHAWCSIALPDGTDVAACGAVRFSMNEYDASRMESPAPAVVGANVNESRSVSSSSPPARPRPTAGMHQPAQASPRAAMAKHRACVRSNMITPARDAREQNRFRNRPASSRGTSGGDCTKTAASPTVGRVSGAEDAGAGAAGPRGVSAGEPGRCPPARSRPHATAAGPPAAAT